MFDTMAYRADTLELGGDIFYEGDVDVISLQRGCWDTAQIL